MKTDIELLIENYQIEHDSVENEIQECIKEWDYKSAHQLKRSLIYLREKLVALKSVMNPNYKEIEDLKARNERISTLIESKLSGRHFGENFIKVVKENYKRDLVKNSGKIENLENQPIGDRIDSVILVEAIDDVLDNRLNRIILSAKGKEVDIEISKLNSEVIRIRLGGALESKIGDYLHKGNKKVLRKLEFEARGNAYVKRMNCKETSPDDILQILSIISFEVFDFSGDAELTLL